MATEFALHCVWRLSWNPKNLTALFDVNVGFYFCYDLTTLHFHNNQSSKNKHYLILLSSLTRYSYLGAQIEKKFLRSCKSFVRKSQFSTLTDLNPGFCRHCLAGLTKALRAYCSNIYTMSINSRPLFTVIFKPKMVISRLWST